MELGDLKKKDITHEVPFGKDGKVLLRYVIKSELLAIEEEAGKKDWAKGAPTPGQRKVEANRLLGRAAVRGWSNLTVGGEEFPYSPENCDLLMEKSYDFSDLVNIACVQIGFFEAGKEEDSKKKSGPMSSGS